MRNDNLSRRLAPEWDATPIGAPRRGGLLFLRRQDVERRKRRQSTEPRTARETSPRRGCPGGGITLRGMPAELSSHQSTDQVADDRTTLPYHRRGGPDYLQDGRNVDNLLRRHS